MGCGISDSEPELINSLNFGCAACSCVRVRVLWLFSPLLSWRLFCETPLNPASSSHKRARYPKIINCIYPHSIHFPLRLARSRCCCPYSRVSCARLFFCGLCENFVRYSKNRQYKHPTKCRHQIHSTIFENSSHQSSRLSLKTACHSLSIRWQLRRRDSCTIPWPASRG